MITLLPALALAHGSPVPEPIAVHAPAGGRLLVETTIGRFSWDGSDWTWGCEQPLVSRGALSMPRYALHPDGRTLAAVVVEADTLVPGAALSWSDDGCTWTPVAGLQDADIGEVTWDGDVALAVGDGEIGNAVWRSDDGRNFTQWLALDGKAHGLWAKDGRIAVVDERDGVGVLRRFDGAWTDVPVPVDPAENATFEVLAAEGGTTWVRVDPFGSDRLLRHDAAGWTTVLDGDGLEILDMAHTPGAWWVVVGGRELWRSADGIAFTRVEDAPEVTAIDARDDRLYLATRMGVERWALMSTTDGTTFSGELDLLDVAGPTLCPAASDGAMTCDPLWNGVQQSFPGKNTGEDEIVDTATPPRGCASTPTGGAWLLIFGLLALRRRG